MDQRREVGIASKRARRGDFHEESSYGKKVAEQESLSASGNQSSRLIGGRALHVPAMMRGASTQGAVFLHRLTSCAQRHPLLEANPFEAVEACVKVFEPFAHLANDDVEALMPHKPRRLPRLQRAHMGGSPSDPETCDAETGRIRSASCGKSLVDHQLLPRHVRGASVAMDGAG